MSVSQLCPIFPYLQKWCNVKLLHFFSPWKGSKFWDTTKSHFPHSTARHQVYGPVARTQGLKLPSFSVDALANGTPEGEMGRASFSRGSWDIGKSCLFRWRWKIHVFFGNVVWNNWYIKHMGVLSCTPTKRSAAWLIVNRGDLKLDKVTHLPGCWKASNTRAPSDVSKLSKSHGWWRANQSKSLRTHSTW